MCKLPNFKSLSITIFSLVVLLGATQLILANEMSTEGQKIRELEEQKFKLGNEVLALEKEMAALGSLMRIESQAQELGFSYNSAAFEYLSPPKLAQAP